MDEMKITRRTGDHLLYIGFVQLFILVIMLFVYLDPSDELITIVSIIIGVGSVLFIFTGCAI